MDIARQRLFAQRLAGPPCNDLVDAVRWLGAVQAQDYAGAKWAIGQRAHGVTDRMIDRALAAGAIVRTHVLRPTWHLVAPEDIRWLLALTAPRVKASLGPYDRQIGLDGAAIARAKAAIAAALQGGQQLTRVELAAVLTDAGFVMAESRGYGHLIMHAELDGVICSAGLRGKQFTYALLDERVPPAPALPRDEALAELTRRYFTSHGPATVHDFAWWSGLTITDARHGLEIVRDQLRQEIVDDRTYWLADAAPPAGPPSPTAFLLPNYDEFLVAYRDRSAALDPRHAAKVDHWTGNVLFSHTIVMDGAIIGTWTRTVAKHLLTIEAHLFEELSDAEHGALTAAAARYGAFLELPVRVV